MRKSSKNLSVFDFEAEQSNDEDGRLNKYLFMQTFTPGNHHFKQSDISSLSPIDSLQGRSPQCSTPERNVISTGDKFEFNEVLACTTTHETHVKICPSGRRLRGAFQDVGLPIEPSGSLLASVCDEEDSETQSSETPAYLMSDVDENCTSLSGASSSSGPSECSALGHNHSACEEMEDEKPVIVYPDYVTHGDAVFLESRLSFYSDCIIIECSEENGTDEKLVLEHDITDVIRIGCQWSISVEVLVIKFWIRTNIGHKVNKIVASAMDRCCWLEKEQKIKSLAKRYTDIWDNFLDNDYGLVDDMLFRDCMSFSKRYFTEVVEAFEDVIYPRGDADAVCISKSDIELLEPNTFINDTIIDFYIKYLQDKIPPDVRKRFYFFNSFFFRKLADLDKNPASISEGRAAFQRVRKWTRKVNIFEKDYVFIPVNFNLHWSLLVICHPGEITTFNGDAIKKSPKVPCILHMDSIKGSHAGLKNLIQSYLFEEWKGRNPESRDDISSKFSNLRFVSLELPQQENSSDCGLFVLHYVELFLQQAPICFNHTQITKLSSFLNADWFPPAEASFKRLYIRGLLYELLRDSAQERNPIGSNTDFPCSGDDVDQSIQFLSTQDSPLKIANGSTSMLHSDENGSFEKTVTLETADTRCPIEVHGDDAKADATEQLLPAPMEIKHVSVVESCEMPPISMQQEQISLDSLPTASNLKLPISINADASQTIASLAFDSFAVAPDTPDTTRDDELNEPVKPSQVDDTTCSKRHEEETCWKADRDECRDIPNVTQHEDSALGESSDTVMISAETDRTPTKRGDVSVSERRGSKRRKVVRYDGRRRVTRSSAKKMKCTE